MISNAIPDLITASACARGLSALGVTALSVRALGLDAESLDLESPEALAALIRRAASFATPCSPRELRGIVLQSLRGLSEVGQDSQEALHAPIDQMIEALTSYGDLIELPVAESDDGVAARTLYLAPPTYVCVDDVLFLLGGVLDGGEPVPSNLRDAVAYRSHSRRIHGGNTSENAKQLHALGWVELRYDLWLPAPSQETPEQLVASANAALAANTTAGEVPGLTVLDPKSPTTYYRGRWADPVRKTGRFVARREQRYGADLWSYVELVSGAVSHLVDFPLTKKTVMMRPCDEAWHLQLAIDALAGQRQQYRRRPGPPSGVILVDFFSPVPFWARRRWDVLGERIASHGSLFAYRFPANVFADVERTLQGDLWLAERLAL